MERSRRHRAILALILVSILTAGGCTGARAGHGRPRSSTGSAQQSASAPTSSTQSTASAPTCSAGGATYRPPDTNRPVVALTFAVADDLHTVRGTEHIAFTPDRPITELVFRLTANTAPTAAEGNGIRVTSATADHGAGAPTYTADGAFAQSQGGLLHIPFAAPIAVGTTVTADLAFTLTLGSGVFDRFGQAAGYAWFASAQPLLAWERGFGWHEEPMLQFTAESATSEAMQTELTVQAPAADTVIMSGDPTAGASDATGHKVWHASLAAARDVSVAIGPFSVSDTMVGGVSLRVAGYTPAVRDQLVPEFQRALTELAAHFGPYPFPTLSVARLPGSGGGIEYPSSILMFNSTAMVAVHETAHQWFYAMVGDSQALHAWLDEAFASYAEQLVNNDPPPVADLTAAGSVDTPTAAYGGDANSYYFVTYNKGAAALQAARAAAGADAFDAAIRCYVAANAWRIANPADLATALAALPAALAVLQTAHALP